MAAESRLNLGNDQNHEKNLLAATPPLRYDHCSLALEALTELTLLLKKA